MDKSKKNIKKGDNVKMYFKFDDIKKSEEAREVWGIASAEIIDSVGDIVLHSAMKDAWNDYMQYGNIREMHQPSAVGTIIESMFNDVEKYTFIKAKIVDDNAWEKVKTGVYKGFSIGAQVLDAEWRVVDEKEVFVITKIKLVEISLVDRPANQEANIESFKFISLTNDSMTKNILAKFMGIGKEKKVEKSETLDEEVVEENITDTTETDETVVDTDKEVTTETDEVETETDEKETETEKTVTISEKSLNSLEEQVKGLTDNLEKVLSFNEKLVKGLNLSFNNISDKFEKVDEIGETLKAMSSSKKSVQKDMGADLVKSQNKEVSLADVFGIGGSM